LLRRVVVEELLKEDTAVVEKLKSELAEATSSLKFGLDANMDLESRNKDLQLGNEAAKGEVSELKKMVENLRAENNSLQEHCWASEEKEKAITHRVDVLSGDIVDLGQKMMKFSLDLEEARSLLLKAEKDLYKLQGFMSKQHDFGFNRALRQFAFFDEGKFDNRKDIYQGEFTSVMDIPDKDEEEEAKAYNRAPKAGGDMSAPLVVISD